MPRGGARTGAGRKPDPNSKRQKALAAKAAKPAAKRAVKKARADRGLTLPNGEKSPEAPANWPFGTTAPAPPPAAPPAAADDDGENDDGLTPEQRAGMSPLEYLLAVMRSPKASKSARITAAIQAAPYVHAKIAPTGKKEGKQKEAEKLTSRFAPSAPPRLAAAGGKRLGG